MGFKVLKEISNILLHFNEENIFRICGYALYFRGIISFKIKGGKRRSGDWLASSVTGTYKLRKHRTVNISFTSLDILELTRPSTGIAFAAELILVTCIWFQLQLLYLSIRMNSRCRAAKNFTSTKKGLTKWWKIPMAIAECRVKNLLAVHT